eukprot:757683-Hanusia_phi.AAC.1
MHPTHRVSITPYPHKSTVRDTPWTPPYTTPPTIKGPFNHVPAMLRAAMSGLRSMRCVAQPKLRTGWDASSFLSASHAYTAMSHLASAPLSNGQQLNTWGAAGNRCMASGSSAADFEKVRQVLTTQIDTLSKQEGLMKDLYQPEGWTKVDMEDIMDGRAEVNAVINYEKKIGNEIINVISSYELVQEKEEEAEEDEDEEPQEDEQNGYDPPVGVLFLVGIAKEGQKLPLFFECVGDRHGYEILRVNVGLTYSGFLSEESGQTALLYHVYMSRKHEREGKVADSAVVDQDLSQGGGSPELSDLDDRIQKAVNDLLPARGIDADFVASLIDNLMAQGFSTKMKFMRALNDWLKP